MFKCINTCEQKQEMKVSPGKKSGRTNTGRFFRLEAKSFFVIQIA
ncbi:hypothetical protein I33_2875 [Bacillus subtilis subsp. subtilis str. RO-NN-1]|nr:hypothetical protein I33_2875 [Bacillus subtilis subsp. subtilis str. RO-NN-1]